MSLHSVEGFIVLLVLLLVVRGIPLLCDEVLNVYLQGDGKIYINEVWDSRPLPFGFQVSAYLKTYSLIYAYFFVLLLELKEANGRDH